MSDNFFCALVEQIKANFKSKGGWPVFWGGATTMVVAFLPPWVALDFLEIPPFTIMRLVIPFVWIVYIGIGAKLASEQLSVTDALLLPLWPFIKR
ncbi:hypothetical protein [Comamonas testosteroni]|jgi:hypothetical protein|uniref:hypothetical protein n=1 Tax=Comamonas testosteroni TaxID=285 RepID=UPI0026EA99C7|nr:hypothetical protein [Comamonas testosteroni]